jgi:hypothetical protein
MRSLSAEYPVIVLRSLLGRRRETLKYKVFNGGHGIHSRNDVITQQADNETDPSVAEPASQTQPMELSVVVDLFCGVENALR